MIKTKGKSKKKTERAKVDNALTIFDINKVVNPKLKLVGQMAIAQYLKRFSDSNTTVKL